MRLTSCSSNGVGIQTPTSSSETLVRVASPMWGLQSERPEVFEGEPSIDRTQLCYDGFLHHSVMDGSFGSQAASAGYSRHVHSEQCHAEVEPAWRPSSQGQVRVARQIDKDNEKLACNIEESDSRQANMVRIDKCGQKRRDRVESEGMTPTRSRLQPREAQGTASPWATLGSNVAEPHAPTKGQAGCSRHRQMWEPCVSFRAFAASGYPAHDRLRSVGQPSVSATDRAKGHPSSFSPFTASSGLDAAECGATPGVRNWKGFDSA